MTMTMRRGLLVLCVLLGAAAAASGQAATTDKRAAIKKLLETGDSARQSRLIFEKLLDRFKGPFAASMIADLRGKGFFKALSADEGAELERRIRVFLDDVFAECQGRVNREFTPESLERMAAPAYDKYLTLDDINQLTAFEQSPLGRRLRVLLPEAVSEGVIARLEAKGVFNAPPEEMAAKMEQGRRELQADPSGELQEVLTAAAFLKRLSPDEVKELTALLSSPFGMRLVEVYPKIQGEIQANFWALHGNRVGPLLGEIYSRKLMDYAVWLSEATRPGAPRGVAPPPFDRRPAVVVAPPWRP